MSLSILSFLPRKRWESHNIITVIVAECRLVNSSHIVAVIFKRRKHFKRRLVHLTVAIAVIVTRCRLVDASHCRYRCHQHKLSLSLLLIILAGPFPVAVIIAARVEET